MPGIRKLSLVSIALKLGKFPLFYGFFDFLPLDFPDLDGFRDLTKFWSFNFLDFLASSLSLLLAPNLMTSSLPFLTSGSDMSGDSVVFKIEVIKATILLKP